MSEPAGKPASPKRVRKPRPKPPKPPYLDLETCQRCNLVLGSQLQWVIVEDPETGKGFVRPYPDVIPANIGNVWVGGSITIADGRTFPAAFVVNTDFQGEMMQAWARIGHPEIRETLTWARTADLPQWLGVDAKAVFPFNYAYHQRIEGDAHEG